MTVETYGKYQLLKRLATGGMAQIYLARQLGPEGFQKLLVVKRILPHLTENEEFVQMFLDEARIAARLNHPNIVQIFDLGAQDDSYFIAMEYIHGEDVRRISRRAESTGKPVPAELAVRVMTDACAGLDYAHKKADAAGNPLGIVHRDVSPQNILVSFEGGVKVVDFGIAKAADKVNVTRSGVLKGKYSYMSPEQASGQPVDHRTDIFALGVVLHELLTGARLFKRASDMLTLNAVIECKVPPPSTVRPDLPPSLDALVLKALARKPQDRYADAAAMQLALEEWLLSEQRAATSAQLAAYMRDLYADRLAREDAEGSVVVDEVDGSRSREEEPPPKPPSTWSISFESAAERGGVEATSPERPSGRAAHANARLEPQPPTLADAPVALAPELASEAPLAPPPPMEEEPLEPLPWGMALAALGVLAGVLAVVYAVFFAAPVAANAVVHLVTDPAGATVVWNGQRLPSITPCTLPAAAAGNYPLVLSRRGYRDFHTTVTIPEEGESLLRYQLKEAPASTQPEAGAKADVALTIRSDPADAELYLDGALKGRTPISFTVPQERSLRVRVQSEGFVPQERSVDTGVISQDVEFVLKRRPPLEALGRVQFLVAPGVQVRCGAFDPMADPLLPEGEYECWVSHPKFGTRQQKVVVKRNETRRVRVRF